MNVEQVNRGMCAPAGEGAARGRLRRRRIHPFWAKQLHQWHWMSGAISLVGILLFAATGITLNHAGQIASDPKVVTLEKPIPPALVKALLAAPAARAAPVSEAVARWASQEFSIRLDGRPAEWSAQEVYVPLPRPGGDGWISFDLTTGQAHYEHTDRGWISWLNDLHKGRDTGPAWRWFIDVFAGACIVFSLTGFFLLQLHARHRRATWPLVGASMVLPLLVIVLFVHR